MKIIKVISENKKTRKVMIPDERSWGKRMTWQEPMYKAKIGYAMCIVEEDGVQKTRHMVKL
jgi:hypothetical protein